MGNTQRKLIRGLLGLPVALAMMTLSGCGGGGGSGGNVPLQINVIVSGPTTGNANLAAGQVSTIDVASGATLEFDSAAETRWDPTSDRASYAVGSFSFTKKIVTVSSVTGGTVAFKLSSKTSASQTATLTVNVAPQQFAAGLRRVGELSTWQSDYAQYGGTTYSQISDSTVSAVNADGSFSLDILSNGVPIYRYSYDQNGAGLSEKSLIRDLSCSDAPTGDSNGFPRYVGKVWTSTFESQCSDGYSSSSTEESTIEGYEKITVGSGTFDALRIRSTGRVTAIDPTAPKSPSTRDSVGTCWWATSIARTVKCMATFTPVGGTGPNDLKTVTQELIAHTP